MENKTKSNILTRLKHFCPANDKNMLERFSTKRCKDNIIPYVGWEKSRKRYKGKRVQWQDQWH